MEPFCILYRISGIAGLDLNKNGMFQLKLLQNVKSQQKKS